MAKNNIISWKQYKAMMDRYQDHSQAGLPLAEFVRNETVRLSISRGVIYSYLTGRTRTEWYQRYYASNEPTQEIEGFIVHHPLTRMAWL
jgi:hypothetical protein